MAVVFNQRMCVLNRCTSSHDVRFPFMVISVVFGLVLGFCHWRTDLVHCFVMCPNSAFSGVQFRPMPKQEVSATFMISSTSSRVNISDIQVPVMIISVACGSGALPHH